MKRVTENELAVVRACMARDCERIAARTFGTAGAGRAALRRLFAVRRAIEGAGYFEKAALVAGQLRVGLYAPGWPGEAFDRYFEHELLSVASPGLSREFLPVVHVAITTRCPLRCEHCSAWDTLNTTDGLSRAEWCVQIAEIQRRGVAQLGFTGGEPMRRYEDLCALVHVASQKSECWVATSGVGLDQRRACELRRAGLSGVQLSLDHWDADGHDGFRNTRGSFRAALAAARAVVRAGLALAINVTVRRDFSSVPDLLEHVRLASRLGASFVQWIEAKPAGRWAGEDVALLPDTIGAMETLHDALARDRANGDLPMVEWPDRLSRLIGCVGAGRRAVYVDERGRAQACPFCVERDTDAKSDAPNEPGKRRQDLVCAIERVDCGRGSQPRAARAAQLRVVS